MGTVLGTGLRELSVALANPFGDDEIDFPVQQFIADLRCSVSAMVLVDDASLPDTSEPLYVQDEHGVPQPAPLPPQYERA